MTPITERWTERSGVRIRYLDNAPHDPTGLPILFSPGFTDFADEYVQMLEFFAPRRVIVVEVRGRGGSTAPATGYRAADHAADLQGVLDEEQIHRYHLMTFSRGTTWGLDVLLGNPARVASVSIGDYRPCEMALGPDVAAKVMQTRFRGLPMTDRVEPHVVTELFQASQARDLSGELAAAGVPVLVATGTEPGCLLDHDALRQYRADVAGVEIVTIPGASHDLFRPDRLAYPKAARSFIERRTSDVFAHHLGTDEAQRPD